MGNKRDPFRFTIRFDETDARHVRVAKLLNGKGRKVAQYLTNAVTAFEWESGREEATTPLRGKATDEAREGKEGVADNLEPVSPNADKTAIKSSLDAFRGGSRDGFS